ncbi:hypothetical protein R6Q59_005941 [Mikania micrantha]
MTNVVYNSRHKHTHSVLLEPNKKKKRSSLLRWPPPPADLPSSSGHHLRLISLTHSPKLFSRNTHSSVYVFVLCSPPWLHSALLKEIDKEHSDPPDANTRVHEVTADSDRLTSLPLHLRYTILSLLLLASAVQTSVFSKGWKHTWKHIRRLHFNENAPFYNRGRLAYIHYKIMEALKGHSLDEFVLHLRLPILPVSSWIDEAIRKNIRTLDVNVDNIDFPDCFFVCGTLSNLKIRCLRFVRDNINHVHVDLPKLVS